MLALTIHSLGSREDDAGTYVLRRAHEVPAAYVNCVSDVHETLSMETAADQQLLVAELRRWSCNYLATHLGDFIPCLSS